eukprot:s27_g7.t3
MHSDCGRELLSYLKDIFRAIFRIGADAKVRRPLRGRLSSHEALVSCPAACEDSARVSSVAMKLSAGRCHWAEKPFSVWCHRSLVQLMVLKASNAPTASALAAAAAVRAVQTATQLPNAVAEASAGTPVERLATSSMAATAPSPGTKGPRAPEFFSIADKDDDSPPTSPRNFNTIPLDGSARSGEVGERPLEKLIAKGGLTEKELRDFEEIQASFDQFRARQTEVERSVNHLLQRLNRRIQVPSSVASSECGDASDADSLGRTEDGLSFLDSCLGSRPGTPLSANSPLGSPRDRISLPLGLPSMPSMPSMPASGSLSDGARRFDGTNPRGSESGDLRPSRAAPVTAESQTRLDKEAKAWVQEDLQQEVKSLAAPSWQQFDGCLLRLFFARLMFEDLQQEVKSLAAPSWQQRMEAVAPALAESSREGVEELEGAGTEQTVPRRTAWPLLETSGSEQVQEVAPHETRLAGSPGGSISPSSPVPAHTEHDRLPQFGSPGVCDETDAVADEEPDLANWYGWTVVATAEGRLFFFHEVRQQSQWHQPAELNPILGVWKEARDETNQGSNVTFWRNDLLRISLWKDPRETSNIFQAAMDGNLFFLQLYSQVSGDLDCTDHRRCSALHYACAGGSAPSTLFLLQQRAMVDRGDVTSTTPLMLACRYGYAGVLKVLLDAQANPCIADHQGQAPLHQAADLGQLDCLHLLLLCGAQAQQRNYQGETALDIAQRKRHLNCLTLLRRHDHFAEHERPQMSQGPYDFSESQAKSATDKAAGLTPWEMADEAESAPWVSAYQEVAANDLIGFPDRYPRYPEIEADSSSDNSDQYTEATDTPRHYRPEAGLLSTLRRRLFPIQADLGLPNRFRFNKATQQWELPSGEADVGLLNCNLLVFAKERLNFGGDEDIGA